jgi:hypothetical protein
MVAFVVISSLMISPAWAETLSNKQDQNTRTISPLYIVAADEAQTTVVTEKKAISGKKPVVGNKDTKGYCLYGMPCYTTVNKSHRIYFESEKQAIAKGYHKAAIDKVLSGGKTIENRKIMMATDSLGSEKSFPEAFQKNEKKLETKAQDTPKTVKEPQKLSGENIQKETVNKETVNKDTVTDKPKDINQKIEDLQKQVDILRDLGRAREKITVGTDEDKAEQEKAILTAAGREYTMMEPGKIEMEYGLSYSYVSSSEILSSTQVVPRVNNTIINAIDVQYGLLKNVTAGIHIPYVYLYDKTGSTAARKATDMGDISLNMSYQPFKSGGDWPNTTISMGVTLPTGRSPYGINRDTDLPTGSGLYGVSLGVNMSKPIDPAMVFGSIGCSYSFERDNLSENNNNAILVGVEPGMGYSAAVGLAYAISYALSMNVSVNYGYSTKTVYHFSNTADSTSPASAAGTLGIGIGYRVSPLTTLSLGLSIGLTKNNSDFGFSFRVPFSF